MNIHVLLKKTLFSVFFCGLNFGYSAPVIANTFCDSQQFDETATVKYVHDGDTIHLSDKRKIRLIGIDTPELARKGRPAQPYAVEAKNALKTLLSSNKYRVNLVYGIDKIDRYGRTLAHLYLDNGTNVQSKLISQGLAIAYTTPPNTAQSECYSKVEKLSQQAKRGFWTHTKYQPLKLNTAPKFTKGFHIIESKVKKVNISQKNIWIAFDSGFNVQIRQKDHQNFDIKSLNCLEGKTIQIRGWLHPKKTGAYMALRHPSALSMMTNNSCF